MCKDEKIDGIHITYSEPKKNLQELSQENSGLEEKMNRNIEGIAIYHYIKTNFSQLLPNPLDSNYGVIIPHYIKCQPPFL